MTEQWLGAPVHASDNCYKLHQRLMGNAQRLIHHAATQNLSRNPLLLWKSRIEAINEDVRINERDHGYRSLRVSSLDQHQILNRSQPPCRTLLHVAVASPSLDQTMPGVLWPRALSSTFAFYLPALLELFLRREPTPIRPLAGFRTDPQSLWVL